MKKTATDIISEINAHLNKSLKKDYSNYYVGITNDIERRLFGEHNVQKDGLWLSYEAINKEEAQQVEEYFLKQGMQGYTGGGTEDSTFVYCYEITNATTE